MELEILKSLLRKNSSWGQFEFYLCMDWKEDSEKISTFIFIIFLVDQGQQALAIDS